MICSQLKCGDLCASVYGIRRSKKHKRLATGSAETNPSNPSVHRQGPSGEEATGISGDMQERSRPPKRSAVGPQPRPSQLLKAALGSDKFFEMRAAILRHQVRSPPPPFSSSTPIWHDKSLCSPYHFKVPQGYGKMVNPPSLIVDCTSILVHLPPRVISQDLSLAVMPTQGDPFVFPGVDVHILPSLCVSG